MQTLIHTLLKFADILITHETLLLSVSKIIFILDIGKVNTKKYSAEFIDIVEVFEMNQTKK